MVVVVVVVQVFGEDFDTDSTGIACELTSSLGFLRNIGAGYGVVVLFLEKDADGVVVVMGGGREHQCTSAPDGNATNDTGEANSIHNHHLLSVDAFLAQKAGKGEDGFFVNGVEVE
jgi:hypothetical protein